MSGIGPEAVVDDPAAKLLRRAPQLHRIQGIRPLHHHTLEKIAAQHTIRLTEPLIERELIGMIFDAELRREANGVDRH